MNERIRIAGCVVVLCVAASAARAEPQTVTIGETVPFSSTDLANAVALRAGDVSLTINVAREGEALKVDVGGASQIVAVDLADPEAAVRVVAMVVIALGKEPAAAPPMLAPQMTAPVTAVVMPASMPTTAPAVSRFAVRGMVGLWRRDDREDVTSYTAAVAYRFAPTWRIAGSMTSQNRITHEPGRWKIVRLGLEALQLEPFGVEGGLLAVPDASISGAYVDARYYLRLGDHFRIVAAVGAHWMKIDEYCVEPCAFQSESTSAYVHGGIEWRL
jgi:hypothetical protein